MVFGKKVIFHLHFYALLKPILNIILSSAANVSFILVTKDWSHTVRSVTFEVH